MTDGLIYGANGYTGQLIAREAVARGLRPTLAGRNGPALTRLGTELGLPVLVFGLGDPAELARRLGSFAAVLHCAGPFVETSAPMAEACLQAGTHYLDITGEYGVFEALARLDGRARAASVTLLPGVGFDVVPTDCLAAYLARRLPTATWLTLAFRGGGGVSRGTALTMATNLGAPAVVRRGGQLLEVPPGWKVATFDFGDGPRAAVTIQWGDVSTAYYSTGIPNIEVYSAAGRRTIRWLRRTRWVRPLLASRFVRGLAQERVRRRVTGPSDEARGRGSTAVWGEVIDGDGRRIRARLRGPEGYTLTAIAAVMAMIRVLSGDCGPGFLTPSLAFGPDFVLGVPGVVREDL